MNVLLWLLAAALNAYLLLGLAPRTDAGRFVKWAVVALVMAVVGAVLVALILHAVGASPSRQAVADILAAFFTVAVILFVNIVNVACRGMVDAIVSFHQNNNAANLDRFPIATLIHRQDQLKLLLGVVWSLGSALMLYGVWFDMAVVK